MKREFSEQELVRREKLDFLRERRNRGCASDSEMSEYLSCIKSILSHDLILNKNDL